MKFVGIGMVKNEADIIEASVRHNLAFLDEFVILENGSTDGTREILLHLQAEGLPLTLYDDPIVGYYQSDKMTAMVHKVLADSRPDFITVLDADEFIIVDSRSALEACLAALPPNLVGHMPWKTYVPTPEIAMGRITDPLRDIDDRRVHEHYQFGKIILNARGIDPSLTMLTGNHSVASRGIRGTLPLPDVAVGHFPIRTLEQFNGKVLVGWFANLERFRNTPYDGGTCIHWKTLYERIARGQGLTGRDVTDEALHYADHPQRSDLVWPAGVVHDPVRPGYDSLRHLSLQRVNALGSVVRAVEYLFQPGVVPGANQPRDLGAIRKIGGLNVQRPNRPRRDDV
jgi:glycosyltransferase involved in cell wall biosynthesis